MFRKPGIDANSSDSDEEFNGRPSRFWKTRSSDDLTKVDRENIALVDRLLEERLENHGPTWSEQRDNWKVENHFREQLTQTPEHELESVRSSHKEFWSDLNADRDAYMKQIAGVNGPSSNIHGPKWANVVLNRRGIEICSNKWRGVEVPNIDPQASPRFASLTMQVPRSKKDLVVSVEQPLPRPSNEGARDGLVLVGVFGALGIGIALKYSSHLTKSVKNLLKKWFWGG